MKKLHEWVAQLRLLPIAASFFAGAFRLIPYALRPPNFAPMGGFALYGGARLPCWQALLLPMLAMAVSDVALNYAFGFPMFDPFAYAGMLFYALLGRVALRHTKSWTRIVGVTILGGLQFFLISNFGVWFSGIGQPDALYAPTFGGLMNCYIAGLPYWLWSIEGDLIFSMGFFALHEWAARRSPAMARVLAPQEGRA